MSSSSSTESAPRPPKASASSTNENDEPTHHHNKVDTATKKDEPDSKANMLRLNDSRLKVLPAWERLGHQSQLKELWKTVEKAGPETEEHQTAKRVIQAISRTILKKTPARKQPSQPGRRPSHPGPGSTSQAQPQALKSNASPSAQKSKGKKIDTRPKTRECLLTVKELSAAESVTLPCGHEFSREGISTWFHIRGDKAACPLASCEEPFNYTCGHALEASRLTPGKVFAAGILRASVCIACEKSQAKIRSEKICHALLSNDPTWETLVRRGDLNFELETLAETVGFKKEFDRLKRKHESDVKKFKDELDRSGTAEELEERRLKDPSSRVVWLLSIEPDRMPPRDEIFVMDIETIQGREPPPFFRFYDRNGPQAVRPRPLEEGLTRIFGIQAELARVELFTQDAKGKGVAA